MPNLEPDNNLTPDTTTTYHPLGHLAAADAQDAAHQTLVMSQRSAQLEQYEYSSPFTGAYDKTARDAVHNLVNPLRYQMLDPNIPEDSFQQLLQGLQGLQQDAVKQKAQQDLSTWRQEQQATGQQVDPKTGLPLGGGLASMDLNFPGLGAALHGTGIIGPGELTYISTVVSSPLRFSDHLARTLDAWYQNGKLKYGDSWSLSTLGHVVGSLGDLPHDWGVSTKTQGGWGDLVAGDLLHLKPGSAPYKAVAFPAEFYMTASMDPIVMASKFKAIADAAVTDALMHNPDAIVALTQSSTVQRAAEALSKLNDGGTVARYLRRAGADITDEGIRAIVKAKTADEVTQVLNDGFRGINGFSAGTVRNVPRVWPGVLGAAQAAYPRLPKLLEALPETKFDLTQPGALTQIQRAADMFNFPEADVNAYMDRFVNATTKADKLKVMDDIYANGLSKMGLSPDVLSELAAKNGNWFDPFREQMQQFGAQKFAGLDEERPVLESQLAYSKSYPDWRAIKRAKALADGGVLGAGEKSISELQQIAQGIMSPIKRVWLMRPAWISKIGLDETLWTLAHGDVGFTDYARHVSASLLSSMEMSDSKLINFIGKGWDSLTSALDRVPGLNVLSPAAIPADMPEEALQEMPSRLSMAGHGQDWISSSAAPKDIQAGEEALVKELAKVDKRFDYKSWAWLDNNQPGHLESWYRVANHQVLNDRVTTIMAAYHEDPALGDSLARQWLQTPEGQQYVKSLRGTFGLGDQAIADIIASHRAMYEHIIPPELRAMAAQGRLKMDDLLSVPQDSRPTVWGRPTIGVAEGGKPNLIAQKYRQFTDWGFKGMGHVVDTMVRDPAWQAVQQQEYERLAAIARETGTLGDTVSEEALGQVAAQYATRQRALGIHNPLERTKLDSMLESHIPFAFAQVQFYKRWARVFAENPGFVRKAALFMGAAQNTGWYEKDDQGNLNFNVPIAPELFNAVFSKEVPSSLNLFGKAFTVQVHREQQLPGGIPGLIEGPIKALDWLTVPEGLPFSGHYEPGFAPWISLPVQNLVSSRPGWKDVRDFFAGDFQSEDPPGRGWLQKIAGVVGPAWLDKLSKAFTGDQADRQWANSTKLVLAYLTANNMDPFDPKVQAKAQQWTKLLYYTRGLDQFFSPYTPVPNIPGGQYVTDYRQLTTQYGYEVGTQKFLDKYPEGQLYTIGLTSNASGAPSTQAGYDFANKNPDFVKKFPDVAYLFAPSGQFDRDIYEEQIGSGVRHVMTLKEWITQAAQRLGDDVYYSQIRPAYLQAQKTGTDKTALHDWLMSKQNQLDSIYPGWKDWHDMSTLRADLKAKKIQEIQQAAFDPAVAKTNDGKAVQAFLTEYNQAFNAVNQAGYATWNSTNLDPIKEALYANYQAIQAQYNSAVLDRVFNSLFKSTILTFEG